jgi:hypothetical protein
MVQAIELSQQHKDANSQTMYTGVPLSRSESLTGIFVTGVLTSCSSIVHAFSTSGGRNRSPTGDVSAVGLSAFVAEYLPLFGVGWRFRKPLASWSAIRFAATRGSALCTVSCSTFFVHLVSTSSATCRWWRCAPRNLSTSSSNVVLRRSVLDVLNTRRIACSSPLPVFATNEMLTSSEATDGRSADRARERKLSSWCARASR